MRIDYHVHLIDGLPVKEVVREDENGDYFIYLNSNLTYEEQQKELDHALYHITHDDFEKNDVQEIEYKAHGGR